MNGILKKEFVLLRCAVFLKFKYEKVNFQTLFFAITLVIIIDIHVNYSKKILTMFKTRAMER